VSHLDRGDTNDRADAAREPVDDFTVADIDGSLDSVPACLRPGADRRQSEVGNARLVEKATQCCVYIVGVEFQNKHGLGLFR
jgi:hypothetical protein